MITLSVSTGRSLSINEVEKVAQGRVWTGEQAKDVNLVDYAVVDAKSHSPSAAPTTTTTTEEEEDDGGELTHLQFISIMTGQRKPNSIVVSF
jgi:ClpP class serine protease